MLRKLKKIFLWFFGTIFALLIVVISLAYIFEDEVKELAIQKLNQNLNAEVNVDEIELSLLSKFPYASLEFSNVLMRDAWEDSTAHRDTFIYAETLYLQFNILDLFSEEYEVKRVAVDNGKINLRINADGKDNFHFWKTSGDTAKSKVLFALDAVVLDETDFLYSNAATSQYYDLKNCEVAVSGEFTASEFSVNGELASDVNGFTSGDVNYLKQKHIDLNLELNVNTTQNKYAITEGLLLVEELPLNINGAVQVDSAGSLCNLTIGGNDIDLIKLTSLLPKPYRSNVEGYDYEGTMQFKTTVTGMVNATTTPEVQADFSITHGGLTESNSGIKLDQLSLDGHYQNNMTEGGEYVSLKHISGKIGEGTVKGKLHIQQFSNPTIAANLNGGFDLSDVQQFLQIDTIEHARGQMQLAVDFKGKASQLQRFSASDFKRSKTEGSITLTNAELQLKGQPHPWKNIQGELVLKNNDAVVSDLSANTQGTDVTINGMFRNFLSWMFVKDEVLSIEAQLLSDQLLLDEVLANQSSKASSKSNYKMAFPANISCNLQAKVGHLRFDRFNADQIHGIVRLKDQVLHINDARMQTMDGRFTLDGEVDGQKPGIFVASCTTGMYNINVKQLFYQFKDFGQTFLQSKHLEGKTNTVGELAFVLDDGLNIQPKSIIGAFDLVIDKGQLNNFETFTYLTDYMRESALLRPFIRIDELEKEMKHVVFERMTNRIEIKNQTVSMPRMELATNVLSLNVAATHSFDQKIDYRFDFRLRDVLLQKQPKEDFGPIADDGTGMRIFLAMKGTVDDYEISMDKEGAKAKRRADLIAEKSELKNILKSELGLFKNDTTVSGNVHQTKPAPEFLIEWEAFEDTTAADANPANEERPLRKIEPTQTHQRPKKNNNPKLKKFLDKLGTDEPPEQTIRIDEEDNEPF